MDVSSLLATKGRVVHTIAHTASINDAVTKLHDERVGALVVTGDRPPLVGLLSERDIVMRLAEDGVSILDRAVADLMTTDVATCAPSTTVMELMTVMTERRIRHVPVLEDNELVGLVSIGDVVKLRLDELERERRELLEYVSAR
jgi:signal-transduction protein with cAMP-binding, CBS, and nucleotidyltransferase domain